MTEKRFTIPDALRFGWETYKANALLLTCFPIVSAAVTFPIQLLGTSLLNRGSTGAYAIVNLASAVIGILFGIAFLRILLILADGGKPDLQNLRLWPVFFKYLGTVILVGLIVMAGTILFIIPGIIWAIKYTFAQYFVVDKEVGPVEAIRVSGQMTKGEKWHIFGFGLVLALLNMLGMLALFVGILVTAPVSALAFVYAYKRLLAQTETVTADVAPVPAFS